MNNLKDLLNDLMNLDAESKIDLSLLFGNVHLMKYEESKGLVWKGMVTKAVLKDELLNLRRLIEKLDVNLFRKVRFGL